MAGNRIHRFGTILTRVEGLLKSGAIGADSKPIWFDVYKRFPPPIEPKFERPLPDHTIGDIVYAEDLIRARFYDKYGSVGLIDCLNQVPKNYRCVSQMFINKYVELARTDPNLTDDQLFTKSSDELIKDGIKLNDNTNRQPSRPERIVTHKKSSMSEIALSDD